jgi:hypothetical protein
MRETKRIRFRAFEFCEPSTLVFGAQNNVAAIIGLDHELARAAENKPQLERSQTTQVEKNQ